MKIKSIRIKGFRRFEDLTILDLPPARLVVIAGPNGSGKSSLFDAFSTWQQANYTGLNWDLKYHQRDQTAGQTSWNQHVTIEFDSGTPSKKSIYLRSAYRNDPDFQVSSLARQGDPADEVRIRRMIDQDSAVSQNYQRLAANAFEDAFERHDGNLTLKEFRKGAIGEIRSAVLRLFPDLDLNTLGNPLEDGTFRFDKGAIKGFSYKTCPVVRRQLLTFCLTWSSSGELSTTQFSRSTSRNRT